AWLTTERRRHCGRAAEAGRDRLSMRFLARAILAAILIWAAYAKVASAGADSTIYGAWTQRHPAARVAVPAAEGLLAIWLLSGIGARASAISTVLVISGLSGVLAAELSRPHPRPCGCMGSDYV